MNRIFTITIIILGFCINAKSQSKLDFCNKWNFEGYIYWGISFSPRKAEKNDYMNFIEDGTFISVDEGKLENGTWEWDLKNKSLIIYESKSNKPLKFGIIQVTSNELIILLSDNEDSIKLKFRRTK
jgi:hypothetical protein